MASTFRRPPLLPQTTPQTGETRKRAATVPTQEYADKLNLAQRLHEQGVDPLSWTKAQPAAFADQDQFRKTGRKPREDQFEVGGRLYDWSPEIAATPAQGRAALGVYLKEIGDPDSSETPPLESYVDIDKVSLRHPFGQPAPVSGAESRDLYLRNMIKIGVNPANAHLGDPVPMPMQDKLKRAFEQKLMSEATPDTATEPEATDMLYRGADGWVYTKNEATRESDEVARIRARHLEKRADSAGSSSAINDNDAEEESEILSFYEAQQKEPSLIDISKGRDQEARLRLLNAVDELPEIITLLEKKRNAETLTTEEIAQYARLTHRLQQAGLRLELDKVNVDELKRVADLAEQALLEPDLSGDRLQYFAAALNLQAAQAMVGGHLEAAFIRQAPLPEAVLRAAKAVGGGVARSILSKAAIAALNMEEDADEVPDLLSSSAADVIGSAAGETAADSASEEISAIAGAEEVKNRVEKYRQKEGFAVRIGNIVVKQHAHTTATDQIFIDVFTEVASSRGCEPEPDNRPGHEGEDQIYGGEKKPQRRITDLAKLGNEGSMQPDAMEMIGGNGGKSLNMFNSVTTRANQVTPIGRELEAARRGVELMVKQVAASEGAVGTLSNPVRTPGYMFIYGKKWKWALYKIRRHLKRKLEDIFDTLFQDCAPTGEPTIVQLDDVNDPEFLEDNQEPVE